MVTVEYNYSDNVFNLSVKGHAGLSEKGTDICCAGISTLVVALDKELEKNSHMLFCQPSIRIEEGYAGFFVVAKSRYKKQVKDYFDMCMAGLNWISGEFPDHLKII